jgi:hypothetical protein
VRAISSWLAVVFGLSMAVLEIGRNWGHWQWWPFWLVDYVAASLLVSGGLLALKRGATQVLCSAWGFTCAMFWMSFFGHLREAMNSLSPPAAHERSLTIAIGVMFVITVVGMVVALWPPSQSERLR